MGGSCGLGILDRSIRDTPIAVIDFETTGLTPGPDRVIEVSVVRIDPAADRPTVVLDTLVNPGRSVAATHIHGITDRDVVDAPGFAEIAGDLVRAISGCVVAAYNVYFDMKFLTWELARSGVGGEPPHFCLMYLRPMLDMGPRRPLDEACREYDIACGRAHAAADDAMAAAELMKFYRRRLDSQGIDTFGQLAKLRKYKFVDSFRQAPLSSELAGALGQCNRLKSRIG